MLQYLMKKKKCSKCGELKNATNEFYRNNKASADGLRPDCKDCQSEAWRLNYPNIAEKHRARVREFRENNPKYVKQYQKKYYLENYEKIKSVSDRWVKSNRLKYNCYHKFSKSVSTAKEFGCRSDITSAQIFELMKNHDGTCHYCKSNIGNELLTIDHVVPLSSGGENTISNIVPCCLSCNMIKSNKTVEQFRKYMGF